MTNVTIICDKCKDEIKPGTRYITLVIDAHYDLCGAGCMMKIISERFDAFIAKGTETMEIAVDRAGGK